MSVEIVPIRKEHNEEVCRIIQSVGAEFGAVGEGFGPGDAEVLDMSGITPMTKTVYICWPHWMAKSSVVVASLLSV